MTRVKVVRVDDQGKYDQGKSGVNTHMTTLPLRTEVAMAEVIRVEVAKR